MFYFSRYIRTVVGVPAAVLWLGFGIVSSRHVPDSALVYVSPNHVFYAPPCISLSASHSVEAMSSLVLTTIQSARAIGATPDRDCVNTGAFYQDGRSLSGLLLEYVGLFPPLKSRWNEDGSWNW